MKLFVTDYDDTLYIGEKEIKKTIKLLKKLQKNDYYIVISTGRSYPSIKKQVTLHNIPYDFISCADGSIIYDNQDNIINIEYLNEEIVKPLEEFYNKINFEEIQFSYDNGYSNIINNDKKLLGINVCIATDKYNDNLVNEFLKLKEAYPNYNYLPYKHPNYSYLCVKPLGITKSYAINFLMNYTKTLKEDIYVIGDSSNDYEMIKDYQGVCVKNSCDKVLMIAKKKYQTIDDYIYELLKKD